MAQTEVKISGLGKLTSEVKQTDIIPIVSNGITYNITVGNLQKAVYTALDGKESYLGVPNSNGKVLTSDIFGNRSWVLGGGAGVPEGGTEGQIIVKTSDVDGETQWQNQIVYKGLDIPLDEFAEDGDTYVRYNVTPTNIKDGNLNGPDDDIQEPLGQFWNGLDGLYDGNGTDLHPFEVYIKISGAWIKETAIPDGGTVGQALVKVSGNDGDVQWSDVEITNIVYKGTELPSESLGATGDKYMRAGDTTSVPTTLVGDYILDDDVFTTREVYYECINDELGNDEATGGYSGQTPLSYIELYWNTPPQSDVGVQLIGISAVLIGYNDEVAHNGDTINFNHNGTDYTITLVEEDYIYCSSTDNGFYSILADTPSGFALSQALSNNPTTLEVNTLESIGDYKEYTKTSTGWKRVFTPIVFKGLTIPSDSLGQNGDKYMEEAVVTPVDFTLILADEFVGGGSGTPPSGYPVYSFATTANTLSGISGQTSGHIDSGNAVDVGLQYFGADLVSTISTLSYQLRNGSVWTNGVVFVDLGGVPTPIPTPIEAYDETQNSYLMDENSVFLTTEEQQNIIDIVSWVRSQNGSIRIFENASISGAGGHSEYKEYTKINNKWEVLKDITGLERINEGNGEGWRLVKSDGRSYGAIGDNSVDLSVGYTTDRGATGYYSFCGGINTVASAGRSIAMGGGSQATDKGAISLGMYNTASGIGSTAIGGYNTASGDYSVALGSRLVVENDNCVAIGKFNGSGYSSVAGTVFEIGIGTSAGNKHNAFEVYLNGTATMPEATIANINAKGAKAIPTVEWVQSNSGQMELYSNGFRIKDIGNPTTIGSNAINFSISGSASGNFSFTQGATSEASGDYAVAMGRFAVASGEASVAFGRNTTAQGYGSVAIGKGYAQGTYSVVMGGQATAQGDYSLALGNDVIASSTNSVVIGINSTAFDNNSVAIGTNNSIKGSLSAGLGYGLYTTTVGSQIALGKYNVAQASSLLVVGNGISTLRANAFEIYTDGRVIAPELTIITDPKSLITKEYIESNYSLTTHDHTGVYEPIDGTILRDADIGVTVEAFDVTILKDADIGSSVQAYDATILNSTNIGVSVEAYLSNPTTDGDILSSTIAGVRSWINPTTDVNAVWGNITGTLSAQTDLQDELNLKEPANVNIQAHIIDTANPHAVTKAQVGLGSADDTADANKPVSTPQQTALDLKEDGLGNPLTGGEVLISTTGGFRSWIAQTVNTDENAVWGNITGTLSGQTDLQDELNLKAEVAGISTQIFNVANGSVDFQAVNFQQLDAKLTASQGIAVADIATPATSTAEDNANKINELLASLRTAGLIAT